MTVLGFFADSYYSLPVMIICTIAAAFVSYRRKNKFKELKYFYLYPIASLAQTIFSLVIVSCLDGNAENNYLHLSVEVFLFFEVVLIYNFFLNVIKMKTLRLSLKVLLIAFLIYSIGMYAFSDRLVNSEKIITGETCIVILAVCFYFIELFWLPPTINIIEQPSFWINIGILFLFSSTLPAIVLAFFANGYMLNVSYYFFINFMGYSVLFLFLIKGYLCRKEEIFSRDPKYLLS